MGRTIDAIKHGAKKVLDRKRPLVKVQIVERSVNESLMKKNYIVTGGGSGLGFAIAKALINCGGYVIITGRNGKKLEDAVQKLGADKSRAMVCDMQNISDVKRTIDECFKEFGHIDGIINNAGISLHEWDFLKVTEEGFDAQVNTNLKGGYFAAQEYIRCTLDLKKEGNVLFISSERGTMCDDLPYGLTKRAIDSLTEALSYKYYRQGIRVNAIAPGVTATEMTGIDASLDLYSPNTSGRFFIPEEIAEIAIFLLSDNSKCISGQIIHANGGNHIKRGY